MSTLSGEFPEQKQRAAVCYRQWRGKGKKNEMGLKDWYDFQNKDDSTEITIYDDIGGGFFDEGVTAKGFIKELNAIPKEKSVTVAINSRGGSVREGLAIYNALKRRKNVSTRCDGLAASIASVVLMSGDTVTAAKNATVMVHDPSALVHGTAADMRKMAEVLDQCKGQLVQAYVDKTGMKREDVENYMTNETWMDVYEAKDLGFIDEVEGEGDGATNFDLSIFNHAPDLSGSVQPRDPAGTSSKAPSVKNRTGKSTVMNRLLETLADCGIIPPGTVDESAAVNAVKAFETTNKKAFDEVKKRNEKLVEEVKARVKSEAETYIDAQIESGKLKKTERTALVEAYAANPDSVKAILASVPEPAAPAGAEPPPAATGNSPFNKEKYPITAKLNSMRLGDPERVRFKEDHWKELSAEAETYELERQKQNN
jgi:ATP-dependent Clp endopeptidase proteolytic subunit ClpP